MAATRATYRNQRSCPKLLPVAKPDERPLHERLTEARTQAGLSKRKLAFLLAAELGIGVESARSNIHRWEDPANGEIHEQSAFALAKVLNKPPGYFFTPRKPRSANRLSTLETRVSELEAGLARLQEGSQDRKPPTGQQRKA